MYSLDKDRKDLLQGKIDAVRTGKRNRGTKRKRKDDVPDGTKGVYRPKQFSRREVEQAVGINRFRGKHGAVMMLQAALVSFGEREHVNRGSFTEEVKILLDECRDFAQEGTGESMPGLVRPA
jgi:hypothetical protein